jgi:hypothetical protein
MSSSKSLVYFVIGSPGSGRRAVVRDLVQNGLGEAERALVLISAAEKPAPADELLGKLKNASVLRWQWTPPGLPAVDAAGFSTIFLVADGLTSPIDQLEALKPWLLAQGAEIARVLCVVDCQLAEKQPSLRLWFDACIHFADVVFLAKREGVANKWLSDFIAHYKDQCFPCHFIHVKKGDFPNPALLLDATPRRVSQYFDEGETVYKIEGLETDDDEGDEDDTGFLPEEPYFVRQRSGRREREVPDLKHYLPGE